MPLLIVGPVAYETVKTPSGQSEEVLAGSAAYASLAAGYFGPVRLVTCLGSDLNSEDRFFLESRNIDLRGAKTSGERTPRRKTTGEKEAGQVGVPETDRYAVAGYKPQIPDSCRASKYILLCGIGPGTAQSILAGIEAPVLTACSTDSTWLNSSFAALAESLRLVHILLVPENDICRLAGESNRVTAARRLLERGPAMVVVKHTDCGMTLFDKAADGERPVFSLPAFPTECRVDPTGTGEAFAGGFMGYLAEVERTDPEAIRRAATFGTVMAGFTVEKASLCRLRNLTFTDIRTRYREFAALTTIPALDSSTA